MDDVLLVFQDFSNFIPDYPHIEFTQECKVGCTDVIIMFG